MTLKHHHTIRCVVSNLVDVKESSLPSSSTALNEGARVQSLHLQSPQNSFMLCMQQLQHLRFTAPSPLGLQNSSLVDIQKQFYNLSLSLSTHHHSLTPSAEPALVLTWKSSSRESLTSTSAAKASKECAQLDPKVHRRRESSDPTIFPGNIIRSMLVAR